MLSTMSFETRSIADWRARPHCVYHPLADKRRDANINFLI
jgi:hypothetical protein